MRRLYALGLVVLTPTWGCEADRRADASVGFPTDPTGPVVSPDESTPEKTFDDECTNAYMMDQRDGSPSGIEHCDNGMLRRVSEPECYMSLSQLDPWACSIDSSQNLCNEHSACTERANGRCLDGFYGFCECQYTCATDEDCKPGEACACGYLAPDREIGEPGVPLSTQHRAGGTCFPAGCKTSDDCGQHECLVSGAVECGWSAYLDCETPEDECHGSYECNHYLAQCNFDEAVGHFRCEGVNYECGLD